MSSDDSLGSSASEGELVNHHTPIQPKSSSTKRKHISASDEDPQQPQIQQHPLRPTSDSEPESQEENEQQQRQQVDEPLSENKTEHMSLTPKSSSKKRKRPESTSKHSEKKETAVMYISRIPPGMEITQLRSLLSRTGRTGRIWLRPHDTKPNTTGAPHQPPISKTHHHDQKRRRRQTVFRDGWIEFLSRRHAKRALVLLNGRPMLSGKKRGRWADDLWSMKLLKDFSWTDLDQEVFGNSREHVLRVREQVAGARRERAWVEEKFDLSRKLERKNANTDGNEDDEMNGVVKVVRRFRQKGAMEDVDERQARLTAEAVDREIDTGVGHTVDPALIEKLFKKR